MTIKSLILQGEGEQLDFKNRISNCEKIAKTLVAFANTKGGKLLVGVADNGTIKGVKNEEEEKYMLQRAGRQYCRPTIDVHFEEIFVEDKLILLATVSESDTKPHYALSDDKKWWVYVRVQDKSMLASKVMVDVFHQSNRPNGVFINYSDNAKELLGYLQAHAKSPIRELTKHLGLSRRKIQRILVNLIVANVIEIHCDQGEEYFSLSLSDSS